MIGKNHKGTTERVSMVMLLVKDSKENNAAVAALFFA
jgi:hypothetical protein